jgi:protein-S-isoprenylcysteine O-methyltransferase Ste14
VPGSGAALSQSRWQSFARKKAYDLVAAAPLAAWYLLGVWVQRPVLALRLGQWRAGAIDMLGFLQLLAVIASGVFSFLLVALLVIRAPPTLRSKGIAPRLAAVLGTFISVGIIHLRAQTLPIASQALADLLLIVSSVLAIIVMARLGDAFAIMPEARRLVTTGPYAIVRHPLYAVELIGIAGLSLQFEQPWASLLALASLGLQILRSDYEERVLLAAYPEYAQYRARTRRFVPYLI